MNWPKFPRSKRQFGVDSKRNPIELNKYVRSLLIDNNRYYVVIDEIQNVYDIINPIFTDGKIIKAKKKDEDKLGFVQVVLGLMKINNVDLYLTFSLFSFFTFLLLSLPIL